ncbi:MAG: PilZ domain-containing protein [Deltaproteobacteria bacterium]|nr:PilZ domain-containing protein [Deltaproteobacteria bacterium]
MSTVYPTKRRYPRRPIRGAALVRCDRVPVAEGFTRTRVVGLGGCGFESDELLGVGRFVELVLRLERHTIRALGRIVYERPLEPGRYEVGVEFLRIPEEHRAAIRELFPEEAAPAEPEV